MAQLSDDCFANGGALLRLDRALDELLPRLLAVTGQETAALADALGRVLAAPVVAPLSVPAHDNSAVDGYAVRFDDLSADRPTLLPVIGRAAAGHPFAGQWRPGSAVRVLTGAVMPAGPDTVLMQEDCSLEGDRVAIPPGIKRGANRRLAGEDVTAGAVVLPAGRRLRAPDVGLLAAMGYRDVAVRQRLRVAVLSTGDEIREPGQPLPAGAVYDSNRFTLCALLRGIGAQVEDLGIVGDSLPRIAACLAAAAVDHDAVITSGGVSTGEEDHVKAAIEAQGELHFWRLAIKPGRPVALGRIGKTPFFGLPGNPVASVVTFLRFVRPVLLALAGAEPETPQPFAVTADFSYRKKADRREWVRVSLRNQDGRLLARKYPRDGAGILSSLVGTDGLVELPEPLLRVEPGDQVQFFPYSSLGL